jgi:23S rRNA (cytidine1920-2'-O)/16S rRNA (cytidine1409-2'-O)-methyltransferase
MKSANEIYKKMRLDRLLVERGLAPTRSRAADLVRLGAVTVAGALASKPGMLLATDTELSVAPGASPYVSRGGLKLAAALDAFGLDPAGLVALDLGASTGGFTEVLLERGAAQVYAVDVGRGQLHPQLRGDPRVSVLEATDARELDAGTIPEPVGAIVADLSFISLIKALSPALRLAAPGAWLVALVKPQFEAGREAVGSGGIVRDERVRTEAVARVREFVAGVPGWEVIGEIPSPIQGADGNVEALLAAQFDKT